MEEVPLRLPPKCHFVSRFQSFRLAFPVVLSLFLIDRGEDTLIIRFALCILYLALIFILFKYGSKQHETYRRTVLLTFNALYPLIITVFEDKNALLFTSSLSALLCVLLTDSLSEILITHMAHSFLAYFIVFVNGNGHEKSSIELIGWKMNFLAALIWIFVSWSLKSSAQAAAARNTSLTLTVEELKRKNSELKDTLQDKEDFILSFSHEFKNLLGVLLGNLNLAARDAYSSASNPLKTALISGEVMKIMVLNVLDAGKHEQSANLEIKPQRTHLPSLLENIWSLCADIISSKNKVTGRMLLAGNTPHYVQLDPQRMLQIFLNLITNATKFTDKGSITIKVSWEDIKVGPLRTSKRSIRTLSTTSDQPSYINEDPSSFDAVLTSEKLDDEEIRLYETRGFLQTDPDCFGINLSKREWAGNLGHQTQRAGSKGILKISIQDTGIGMTKEQSDKLFQRFSQVSEDENKRLLGSGLGLWITKQIIEQHMGKIEVDSKEGTGTRFEVTLPTIVEDSIGNPSIEISHENILSGARRMSLRPGSFTRTNLSKENLSRENLSRENLTRNNLTRANLPDSARNVQSRGNIHISIQDLRAASTTSLDTPLQNRNPFHQTFGQYTNPTKILIIEDDAFSLEMMKKFVEDLVGPNRTLLARSGEEVAKMLEDKVLNEVKLAFIDKNLQDMTGIKIIKELKDTANAEGIDPISCFLVSGESPEVLESDLQNFNFIDGCLPKPVDVEELEKIISDYFF